MSQLKTQPNDQNVHAFIGALESEQRKSDALILLDLFNRVTEHEPVMWGDSIIGFGSYRYTNTRGKYSWLMTGFSPRKSNMTLYIMQGFDDFADDLESLGKTKQAKSCLYIKKLSDVDLEKLESFLVKTVADMRARFECD